MSAREVYTRVSARPGGQGSVFAIYMRRVVDTPDRKGE